MAIGRLSAAASVAASSGKRAQARGGRFDGTGGGHGSSPRLHRFPRFSCFLASLPPSPPRVPSRSRFRVRTCRIRPPPRGLRLRRGRCPRRRAAPRPVVNSVLREEERGVGDVRGRADTADGRRRACCSKRSCLAPPARESRRPACRPSPATARSRARARVSTARARASAPERPVHRGHGRPAGRGPLAAVPAVNVSEPARL